MNKKIWNEALTESKKPIKATFKKNPFKKFEIMVEHMFGELQSQGYKSKDISDLLCRHISDRGKARTNIDESIINESASNWSLSGDWMYMQSKNPDKLVKAIKTELNTKASKDSGGEVGFRWMPVLEKFAKDLRKKGH